jgi:LEA14-like dessication related protein
MKERRLVGALLVAGLAASSGCATGPEGGSVPPPEIRSQQLHLNQDLTNFHLRLEGEVGSALPATVERAKWEMVVEEKVVKSGEHSLGIQIPENGKGGFEIQASSRYVATAAELKAMSDRGGSLLAALRGTLFVRRGGTVHELPFARSREVRTPRLPSVKLHDIDAGRYSDRQVNVRLGLGVVNPNPFPLAVSALDYRAQVAGKEVSQGTLTRADTIEPSSTGVFEVTFEVDEQSHGADVTKLIKSLEIPWSVAGDLRGELYSIPYAIDGKMRLNVSK